MEVLVVARERPGAAHPAGRLVGAEVTLGLAIAQMPSGVPVGTLAEKHGFTNDKLFHRLFRERFHTTPLQLRKAAREKGS